MRCHCALIRGAVVGPQHLDEDPRSDGITWRGLSQDPQWGQGKDEEWGDEPIVL